MATFSIEAPNGKSYTIEGESADGALAALRKHLGGDQAQSPQQTAVEPDDHGLAERQRLSPFQKAINPITSYPATQAKMAKESFDQMSRGVSQLGDRNTYLGEDSFLEPAKAIGNVALGALGYVGSPISAAYRTVVGQPIEDVTGIPREYTEFAAQMATPGIGLTSTARAPATPRAPNEIVQAADRLSAAGSSVQVPKAIATDSPAIQRAAATVRNIPLAGDPLVSASERTLSQLGTKADEVADALGGSSVQAAGDTAKGGIVGWIKGESGKKVSQLYDAVDNLVNPNVKTEIVNTRGVAAEIEAERMAAHLPNGKAVETILDAVNDPAGLTYHGIKTLRTKIGEAMNSGILPEGMSGSDLKRIYAGLSDDLKSATLRAGGQNAVNAFERANRYSKLVSDRRESLAKIVGASGDVPAEKVFDRLAAMAGGNSRADIEKLSQARKAIGPDDWNEFASGVVSRLGRDTEGNFSPARFLNDYNKLSDAGKSILFRSGGKSELAQHLDDIATISSRYKDLQKFANPSGTAQGVIGSGLGASIVMPLMHGDVKTPLITLASVMGGRVLAQALSQPATAASIAKISRAQFALATSPSAKNVAAYSLAARNLINTMGERAQGLSPSDFIRALQGPVRAPASDENPEPKGIVDR